ncbi:MAG: hypothetical protein OXF56_18545 [Rhodobacteraceae bacterium]|nr:hypothetical protein [Paracoccaceae bacterium]
MQKCELTGLATPSDLLRHISPLGERPAHRRIHVAYNSSFTCFTYDPARNQPDGIELPIAPPMQRRTPLNPNTVTPSTR